MKTKYYLAYGSNLHMAQMASRCPDAFPVGKAVLKDYRLMFRGSKTGNYLTVEPHKGSYVPLGVWIVSDFDELNLDRYEGFPTFYGKHEMEVEMSSLYDGRKTKVSGMIYIMTDGRKAGAPREDYIATCREGYRRFEFDIRLLEQARYDSTHE